ncbi:BamA/TamA family outer membrane protein [Parerythrobacter aurantius]|uniref:autotransporter assembly complex protein TamA n=1 Tax=Parerythrobacter aurantius TaxID=3127706 RepID=UPI0032443B53
MADTNSRAAQQVRTLAACVAVVLAAGMASPVLAQSAGNDDSEPAPAAVAPPPGLDVPQPPPGFPLPEIEIVIDDEEFDEQVPELAPEDDPELDLPLESIAEFERRLAAEEAGAEPLEGQEAPLGDPALADGDVVEEIGDAPIRDAELLAPLPPLEEFELETVEFTEPEGDDEAPAEVPYRVELTGLDLADSQTPTDMRDLFSDLSALGLGTDTAANISQLRARLTDDSVLLQRIVASEGWYSATVTTEIQPAAEGGDGRVAARIAVDPGPRYSFSAIDVRSGPTVPAGLVRDNLALQVGEPIVATRVQGAEAQVAVALPENGYPFAEVGRRDILLDPESGEGAYTLPVALGPRARFGGIRTDGTLAFDAEHVALLARFERGEIYDSRAVDDLRQALVATGLFNSVAVVPERTGEDAGEGTEFATIVVTQEAGPPRTLAASAGFGTGQGFRVEGSWTHRNLFPPEGALIAQAVAGTQEQGAGVTFRRSNAGRRDLTFSVGAEVLHSDYDAYEAYTGRISVLYSYDSTPIWQKPFTYAVGAQILGTNEQLFDIARGALDRRTYVIGGLTGQVGIDRSDDLLNPTEGFRLTALVEPEGSLQGGFSPYVRARLDGSAYFSPTDSLVLAGRARVGTIQGIDREDLAPSRRFYGGGGGSVRGFGYQQLGPRVLLPNPAFDPADPDEEDNPFVVRPLGGRSLVEGSVELRYRFGNFGAVAFADVGQVYAATTPDFSDLRIGIGVGGRYYTNFGPVRVDVAMPLDRRTGESSFAVYVGIGQAF